jgi:hypothetical protein
MFCVVCVVDRPLASILRIRPSKSRESAMARRRIGLASCPGGPGVCGLDLVDPVRSRHPGVRIEIELRYDRLTVALHRVARDIDLLVIGRHTDHARFASALG